MVPIVDHVLRRGSGPGGPGHHRLSHERPGKQPGRGTRQARRQGLRGRPVTRPVRAVYGAGTRPAREAIRSDPPDIPLTNYMMLELLLTRSEDRELLRAAQGLRFLVFDELHTYRGRQGADIAMLIRRCRHAVGNRVVCIGTSATMASGGGSEQQRREVAAVSQSLFGVPIAPDQVVTESLERATPEIELADPSVRAAIRAAVVSDEEPPVEYGTFRLLSPPGSNRLSESARNRTPAGCSGRRRGAWRGIRSAAYRARRRSLRRWRSRILNVAPKRFAAGCFEVPACTEATPAAFPSSRSGCISF